MITRNPYYAVSNAFVVHRLMEAFEVALEEKADTAFVIGGGEIYRQSMPFLDKIYFTKVDLDIEGDVFFPELKEDEWQLDSSEHHEPDEKNKHPYTFQVYSRR